MPASNPQLNRNSAGSASETSRLENMGLILQRRDQITLFVLLVICSFILGSHILRLHLLHDNVIDVEDMDYRAAAYAVDINSAEWPELANIPNIGEKLAKAIILYRDTHGEFTDLDQLIDVPGIGPSKLKVLQEFSLPIPAVSATQAPSIAPQNTTQLQ